MTSRIQSFATLGLMSLLAAGFGLWSAFTGPKIADVQLHDAAANTLAASGFVETFQFTATVASSASAAGGSVSPGGAVSHQTSGSTTTIDYQAPNRFRVVEVERDNDGKTQTDVRLTQIGSACWVARAPNRRGPAVGQSECAPTSGPDLLNILRDLEHASNVTLRGGVYTLDPKNTSQFLSAMFAPFGALFKSHSVEVRTDGSYLSWMHFQLGEGPGTAPSGLGIDVVLRFTDVGSAPPVIRPAGAPGPTATTVG